MYLVHVLRCCAYYGQAVHFCFLVPLAFVVTCDKQVLHLHELRGRLVLLTD